MNFSVNGNHVTPPLPLIPIIRYPFSARNGLPQIDPLEKFRGKDNNIVLDVNNGHLTPGAERSAERSEDVYEVGCECEEEEEEEEEAYEVGCDDEVRCECNEIFKLYDDVSDHGGIDIPQSIIDYVDTPGDDCEVTIVTSLSWRDIVRDFRELKTAHDPSDFDHELRFNIGKNKFRCNLFFDNEENVTFGYDCDAYSIEKLMNIKEFFIGDNITVDTNGLTVCHRFEEEQIDFKVFVENKNVLTKIINKVCQTFYHRRNYILRSSCR